MKKSVFNHVVMAELRARRGLTLQSLADKVGTSKSHIWELENEKKIEPSLSMAVRIAKALKCSVNRLVKP